MSASDRASIVVLACHGPVHYAVINALARVHDIRAVVFEKHRGLIVRLFFRRLRRLGFFAVVNQLMFKVLDVLAFQREADLRALNVLGKDALFDPQQLPGTRIVETNSVNSDAVAELLGRVKPDVVVVSGTSLLREQLLTVLHPAPAINVHCGITPRYRGVHGAFWAVVNGDWENVGTTVHLIDASIDSGAILSQQRVEVEPDDTPRTLALKQYCAGIQQICDAVSQIRSGNFHPIQRHDLDSRIYSSPTLTAYLTFKKRLRNRFHRDMKCPSRAPKSE
ncbi:MAG: hypothetical protein HY914_09860 [Desulfomonile tiedjei]|nr:hypothetical protein [Desulfomonile tiedjei]